VTNSEWWARVTARGTEHDATVSIVPTWTLRKSGHEATMRVRQVPGIGSELALFVDGELQKSRLFKAHEQAELATAIAETRARFEVRGWQ
jgi:hypothetical protein